MAKERTVPQACKKGEITDGRNAVDLSLDTQVRYRTRTVHL